MIRIDPRGVTAKSFAVLVVGFISAAAAADSYTVQIAAHAHPETARTAPAEAVAAVRTRLRDDGVTLYFAGAYDSVESANQARDRLRELGYVDAFVKKQDLAAAPLQESPDFALPTSELERLRQGQTGELVILDGVPHIKDGNKFTPLHDAGV